MNSITQLQIAHLWQRYQELWRIYWQLKARSDIQEKELEEQGRRIARLEMLVNKTQPEFSAN